MLFRYETEVPLAGWGGECFPTERDSSLEPAWLVILAPETFPIYSRAGNVNPYPRERLERGYPSPVWIRRMGSTCTWNLHGISLGCSQAVARLEWLCLRILRKCASLSGFSGEKPTLDSHQSFASFFPEESLFFPPPPCREAQPKSLDSEYPINLGLNLRSCSYLLTV